MRGTFLSNSAMRTKTAALRGALHIFAAAGAVCVVALFGVIVGALVVSAVKAGGSGGTGLAAVRGAFAVRWAPAEGAYGIVPMIAGTFFAAVLATALAALAALGISCYLWAHDNRASALLRSLLRFMSGVPTVVYGVCGVFILIPFFRQVWGGAGYNAAIVALVLALLILPTIVLVLDSALSDRRQILLCAASLGLSAEAAFIHVALAARKKQALSALLLGFSRALGDTLIALMLSGNTPVMPGGLFSSLRTLSGHISLLTATEIDAHIEFTLFLSGALLFTAALGVSAASRIIGRRT
jgi:phosphate transport system permease protein